MVPVVVLNYRPVTKKIVIGMVQQVHLTNVMHAMLLFTILCNKWSTCNENGIEDCVIIME